MSQCSVASRLIRLLCGWPAQVEDVTATKKGKWSVRMVRYV